MTAPKMDCRLKPTPDQLTAMHLFAKRAGMETNAWALMIVMQEINKQTTDAVSLTKDLLAIKESGIFRAYVLTDLKRAAQGNRSPFDTQGGCHE